MSQIGSIDASAQPTNALALAAANTEAGNPGRADGTQLGLPPAGLAGAAVANTVNAALVSSQWGIDPASFGGVYASTPASGVFSASNLLPLLQSLAHSSAEQALSLIGVSTPKSSSKASSAAAAAAASAAYSDSAASDSTPVIVDPLWGRSA
jgi:hypothetical protein